ncbi:hypothetical protein AB6A40_011616 [Gnathostoma spinigerum]|uniref:Uncharacterized protein n=1 Tax=Gnathostoma spinigerum TaxID=75299 RepID=A0ABD6F4L2_9BILA
MKNCNGDTAKCSFIGRLDLSPTKVDWREIEMRSESIGHRTRGQRSKDRGGERLVSHREEVKTSWRFRRTVGEISADGHGMPRNNFEMLALFAFCARNAISPCSLIKPFESSLFSRCLGFYLIICVQASISTV